MRQCLKHFPIQMIYSTILYISWHLGGLSLFGVSFFISRRTAFDRGTVAQPVHLSLVFSLFMCPGASSKRSRLDVVSDLLGGETAADGLEGAAAGAAAAAL